MRYRNAVQVARWLEMLSSIDMKIIHPCAESQKNAIGIRRIRRKQCGMDSDIQTKDSAEKIEMHDQVAQVTDDQVTDLKSAQDQDEHISNGLSQMKNMIERKYKVRAISKTLSCLSGKN